MFTMFLVAIIIVSSSTWYETNAGRLQNLEKKLHGFEMSVIQDIHLLREDINQAKTKMEEVIASINSTASFPIDESMTEEEEHRKAERIELKIEALVVQQLKRVKRAFVSEKMKLVTKQQEQESNFTKHAQRLENALEAMTEKIDSSITSSSSALHESFNLNVNTINEQVLKTNEAVNKTLLRVERGVNSSLVVIAEKQGEQINTMTEKLENGINKIQQIEENSRNNELLNEILQLVKFTSLMTLTSHAASLNQAFISDSHLTGYLKTCMDLRTHTFEDCRSSHVLTFSKLIDLSKRVRLGNSSITNVGVQGRLEVFYADQWGTVCDDNFNNKSATVACRMLGYPNGVVKKEAYFGQGSLPILLDDIACSGYENSLFGCPGIKGSHNCQHTEDVGVICQG